MATTAVAPGAALGAAGRDSPEQLDDRTADSARLAAPDERTGAG
jgi:hypothetical protein